ncbi:MAG: HAD-IA family hydrolase [Thermodesulfobacteriota bacterium]|jgi:HAD superfamily hydrolase (TIGR01509 family)
MQGLIFDFDGLIVDTEWPAFQTWQEVYQAYGCSLSLSVYAACIGSPGAFDPHAHLEARIGRVLDREHIRLQRRQRYVELTGSQALLPGVEGYITEAKRLGLKLGVASSSSREWVVGHLVRFGLHEYFDCVTCRDDATAVKPDPELYRLALAALELPAAQVIALEDSPNGVLAARRAGIFCVAVPNTITCRLSLAHADMCVPSLAEVPLEQLLARVGKNGPTYRRDGKGE